MKEFFLLRLLDKFSAVFSGLGIDYRQLRLILKVKLILDGRSVPTILHNTKNAEKKNLPVLSMLMYTFMGLIISVFIWVPFSVFYKMNIVIAMMIFMILATMISDFSTVLLDVKDKNILLPRPIDPKALKVAKSIHILYYLFRITLALTGPSLIMCLIHYGPVFFIVFFIEVIFICALVIFFTSLMYFVILRLFDGEKLKDIINYFQIILSIFIAVSYQFVGRMFDISQLNISFTPKWWNYLIPTTWFASPLSILTERNFSAFYVVSSFLAVIIPALAFIIYVKIIVPYFEKNLQKLNDNSGRNRRQNAFSLQKLAAVLVCSNNKEKAFFRFTQNMIAGERKLKLQLYPSLALAMVLPFIIIFVTGNSESFYDTLSSLHSSSSFLSIYIGIAMSGMSVNFISRSEKYQGAWIYRTLPLENPAVVLKGAFKAGLLKFNVPIVGITCIIFIPLFGVRIIPDVILMLVNMVFLTTIMFAASSKQLPFCRDFQNMQEGTNAAMSFLLLFIAGVMAAVHFGVLHLPFGVTANIALSVIVTMVIWHYGFKVSWKDIELKG